MNPLLHHLMGEGVLRPLASPLYRGLIGGLLLWERLRDLCFASPREQAFIEANLTLSIKTFERPHTLKRLIRSIRRFYPKVKIIVVDDSRECVVLEGVEVYRLPYDSGVSAGRNEALNHIDTPYMMLLDDDFIFTRHTRLLPQLRQLEANPSMDLIAGTVIDLPWYRTIDYRHERLHPTSAEPRLPLGSRIDGLTIYDKLPNFYIARTAGVRRVGWDTHLKRLDHADFFTRAKGVLVSLYNPQFQILHARTPFDLAYQRKRYSLDEDKAWLYQKYYRG